MAESAWFQFVNGIAQNQTFGIPSFHETFGGPQSHFADEVKTQLQKSSVAEFKDQIDVVNEWVSSQCGSDDSSLQKRWEGIHDAVQYWITGEINLLQSSINSFDLAYAELLPDAKQQYPSPYEKGRLPSELNKFFDASFSREAGLSLFQEPQWSPGLFLLHDWLLQLVCEDQKTKTAATKDAKPGSSNTRSINREATPILSVAEDWGGNYLGSVQKLVVEKLDGPAGLILPDFFSFGLVGFPPNQEEENFIGSMHNAFQVAMPENQQSRLRWYIEPLEGAYPTMFSGRSAQVAAAGCVLALCDKDRIGTESLLYERVAVTACLGPTAATLKEWSILPIPPHYSDPEKIKELVEVEAKLLPAKLEAAANARLVAVLVCPSQLPQTPENTVEFEEGSKHTLLIQPVNNLEEAYDSLLVTSKAVAEYKQAIAAEWNDKWDPKPTPEEYKNAGRSNDD